MSKTAYKNFKEIDGQQEEVMKFIIEWVKVKKTTVPQKEIVLAMKEKGIGLDSVKFALHTLLAKGYIREGYAEKQNTTVYVQLRGI